MNILTLDTSTEVELITVSKDENCFNASERTGFVHSSLLFKKIDSVLEKADIKIEEIDLIACGIGPGSFTGVRIAVTTARMLAQLLKIPVFGIPSQRFFTQSKRFSEGEQVLVAFDAKKSHVFGALYKIISPGTRPHLIVEEGDYAMEYLLGNADSKAVLYCVGSGAIKYKESVLQNFPKAEIIETLIPDPKLQQEYVTSMFRDNASLKMDYNSLVPLYARRSDAEVAKDAREKKLRNA